jgi:3-deoxy-D-manno-octulosonic-acid transferase
LVDRLAAGPDPLDVVIATTTDTGTARARELFGGRYRLVRYPFDFSAAVDRLLDAVRPDAVALVELEVWPNFVASCDRRGIPVAVINGRLSARSFRRYRLARPFLSPTFARLAAVAAQDEAYAVRFRAMGVPAERVAVCGTMKWDTAQVVDDEGDASAKLALDLGIDRSRPLVVAGSTAVACAVRARAPGSAHPPGAPRCARRIRPGASCSTRSASFAPRTRWPMSSWWGAPSCRWADRT